MLQILFYITFLGFLPNIHSLQCNITGECNKSDFLSNFTTPNMETCIQQCKHSDICHWSTYNFQSQNCAFFANCKDTNKEFCTNCVTNEKACYQTDCNVPGFCKVSNS